MIEGSIKRHALVLTARFFVLAPVCLVLWLVFMPTYTYGVAYIAKLLLREVFGMMITSMKVTGAGFLNTDTFLTYGTADGHSLTLPSVGHLVANVAPYIALVLATPRLGIKRILKIGPAGIAIIFCSHVATIIARLVARDMLEMGRTPLPTAIGFVSVTLPFLLWIVLAYRTELTAFFADEPAEKKAA